MPDYEIRLYDADGSLAFVHVTSLDNDEEAQEFARGIQGSHAKYSVHRADGTAV
jgi:hypothetical protein